MFEWKEFSAKTVEEALTEALIQLETTSDNVEYEVLEKESSGILGLFSKNAKIRVRVKYSLDELARNFLHKIFVSMELEVEMKIDYDKEDHTMNIELSGPEMGILIGKRGQTLDSLQYLTSLVVNKESDSYVKIKMDTENYRERRKETLENLAKNIAHKVKRTRTSVSLEPMNPYERRVIHSILQNDKYVETHSEGDEPYRKVVISLKKDVKDFGRSGKYSYHKNRYNKGYRKYDKNRNYESAESVKSDETTEQNIAEEINTQTEE